MAGNGKTFAGHYYFTAMPCIFRKAYAEGAVIIE